MLKVLILGKSGRIDVIAEAVVSSKNAELLAISDVNNPGLIQKINNPKYFKNASVEDLDAVLSFAKEVKPDLVIVGPEEPLAAGVVDELEGKLGIPTVGPSQELAKIESSKSFTRRLLEKYNIPGNPEFKIFNKLDGIMDYLKFMNSYVIKPDGLTGGKGVKVKGDHFSSDEEGFEYCKSLIEDSGKPIVVEEKLIGQEFSLQSFCDGINIAHCPVVQDHKRAFIGDKGPNTGGMGSYTFENHKLPFLTDAEIEFAQMINKKVQDAIYAETDKKYKGILYGGFIATEKGIKVIEYNARFGDPEVMNCLPLLNVDFVELCTSIVNGTLNQLDITFKNKATVCKYVVPENYPTNPVKDVKITIGDLSKYNENLRMYFGAINQKDDGYYLIGSRALAFVGIGDSISEAESIAEYGANMVSGGPVFHRSDIGTEELISKRIHHMNSLRKQKILLHSN